MENDLFGKIATIWLYILRDDTAEDNLIKEYINEYPSRDFIVDIFPYIIEDPKKEKQVSVFYRKLLEREISKYVYLSQESKFKEFIKKLWLYNDVDIHFSLFTNNFHNTGIPKRIFNNIKRMNTLENVVDFNIIENILTLAFREHAVLYIFFKSWNMIAILNDLHIELIVGDEKIIETVKPISTISSLYIRQTNNRK